MNNNFKKMTSEQSIMKQQFDNGRRISINKLGEYRFTDNGELCRYRTFWNLMSYLYGFGATLTPEQRSKYFA